MTEEDIHINQVLINEGYAQFMEESYASKVSLSFMACRRIIDVSVSN